VRAELLRRLEKLEAALGDLEPDQGAIIWRCGEEVTEADRVGAANAARERGTPNAVLIFCRVKDMSVHREPDLEPEHGTAEHPRLARLLALPADCRRDAISEMVLLRQIDAAEADHLRAAIARKD
jgi:hypothetical protein